MESKKLGGGTGSIESEVTTAILCRVPGETILEK